MIKKIRVMCDYCATGLWVDEESVHPEDYVSPELAKKLRDWNKQYESIPPTPIVSWEQHIEFVHHGLKLAHAVKQELSKTLPNAFRVWYYDPHHIVKLFPVAGTAQHERVYVQL